jgi:hypothetical protein
MPPETDRSNGGRSPVVQSARKPTKPPAAKGGTALAGTMNPAVQVDEIEPAVGAVGTSDGSDMSVVRIDQVGDVDCRRRYRTRWWPVVPGADKTSIPPPAVAVLVYVPVLVQKAELR